MNRRGPILLLAVVAGLALAATGCGGSDSSSGASGGGDGGGDGEAVSVGMLLDATGPIAAYGIPEQEAVEAQVEKINAEGGVNGHTIELSSYDPGSDTTACARGVTELVQTNGVKAIIGGPSGSCTLAAGPVAARSEVPMLAPNSTIEITDPSNDFAEWIFRTSPNDLVVTKRIFDSIVESGAKRIGIFYQEDAYGKDTYEYVKELADENGEVEIVGSASAPLEAQDVSPQMTTIRNSNPDAVMLQTGPPTLAAAAARAAEQVGLEAPLYGGVGLVQTPFLEVAGKSADGMMLLGEGNPDDESTEEANLKQLVEKKGGDYTGIGLLASNGVFALQKALEGIDGEVTGPAIKEALDEVCGLRTWSPKGELCYTGDSDGPTPDSLVLIEVKDGKFKTVSGGGGK